MLHAINDGLSIAGTLVETDLGRLARQGFRTIIDLRDDGESAPGGLRPEDEGALAHVVGLRYRQIPVIAHNLGIVTVNAVGRAIAAAEPRVLLHCASGRRAAFLSAMHLARTHGWSVRRALEAVSRAGVDPDDAPRLRDLLIEIVRCHGQGYAEQVTW